jgi:hypothetical protein
MSTIKAQFRPAAGGIAGSVKMDGKPCLPKRSTRAERLARMLALAHLIERKIEAGELANYNDAARRLGVTRPRISQILGLLALSPEMQERVLLGDGRLGIREAVRVARKTEWATPEPAPR